MTNVGRTWFTFQASKARQQQALAAYEEVIKTAFREVSDALVATGDSASSESTWRP